MIVNDLLTVKNQTALFVPLHKKKVKFTRFNIVILVGFLAILGVIVMQLFLLNQAYSFEKKEVEDKIHYALLDVVERIYVDNNSEFVSEILQSFIQVVSEDLNKIQFCIKNKNDCGKLSLIAQNIASNINLLGKEDLVLRWKNFIHVGLEKMEDKYELLLLIKLTESLVDNVKKYNQISRT